MATQSRFLSTYSFSPKTRMVTLTIEPNADDITDAPLVYTIKAGQGFSLARTPFTRDGFTFSSYNTMADGSGTSYPPAGYVSSLNQDLTLYCIWTAA